MLYRVARYSTYVPRVPGVVQFSHHLFTLGSHRTKKAFRNCMRNSVFVYLTTHSYKEWMHVPPEHSVGFLASFNERRRAIFLFLFLYIIDNPEGSAQHKHFSGNCRDTSMNTWQDLPVGFQIDVLSFEKGISICFEIIYIYFLNWFWWFFRKFLNSVNNVYMFQT